MAQKFDKEALFKWLHAGTEKIESGIEKGVRAAQKAAGKISEKIDANPTTKRIKEKVASQRSKQAEKIKDARIRGKRIGDLPFMAQKLAERQLYKLIHRIRDVDPDFKWGPFMPNAETLPVFEAFDTLGVPYGTPFEEVKKVYRNLLREWHPDKHANDPEKEKLATLKTQEITAAYEIISKHYGMV